MRPRPAPEPASGSQPDDERPDVLAIAEYSPGSAEALTDAQRWPTLDDASGRRLETIRRHPHAPAWSHSAGDRLDADAVRRVQTGSGPPRSDWLTTHLDVARALPAYRLIRDRLRTLDDFPVIGRDDLLRDVSAFVPYDCDLDQMMHGTSSGSTGHALVIPDDIEDTARTLWFMVDLVRRLGVDWRPEPGRMALAHVVRQRQAFTYASMISTFEMAPMARLNLDPAAWPDRDAFLLDMAPQVFSGTPAGLEVLLAPRLVAGLRPLALFSSATELTAGLRAELENAYRVPVIDVYSLHETRPIGVSTDGGPFVIVDRKVHVEILVDEVLSTTPGTYGEIVVTAGENPLLPLVRYRTGDHGRIVEVGGRRAIADLEARADTRFVTSTGQQVPCVDLTQQLQRCGARGWTVHQRRDGTVDVVVVGAERARVESILHALLNQPVTVSTVDSVRDLGPGKPRRYRCDVTSGTHR
ncbi:phenylacetate--CoA ligase family protein [Gordonia insulae]|uniref:Phenylacetate--CoA ligase n=1 Tax=Gordonia insulae TaxID=2420509 RepID=A0A3G8JPQ0_9ACTN|nr:CoF synthetase [Gordonia insulae]AZG46459.1 hypothetical protein D7316_03060 [Gordonia insulae]